MVPVTTRVLAAVATCGVSVLCVIAGFAFRMALLSRWPVAPYRCFIWEPLVDEALLAYILLVPLVAARASEERERGRSSPSA